MIIGMINAHSIPCRVPRCSAAVAKDTGGKPSARPKCSAGQDSTIIKVETHRAFGSSATSHQPCSPRAGLLGWDVVGVDARGCGRDWPYGRTRRLHGGTFGGAPISRLRLITSVVGGVRADWVVWLDWVVRDGLTAHSEGDRVDRARAQDADVVRGIMGAAGRRAEGGAGPRLAGHGRTPGRRGAG
jgi:hypothetical protein